MHVSAPPRMGARGRPTGRMICMQGGERCPCESAAEANRRLRDFVRGRAVWTPEALAEYNRLRALWLTASRREIVPAA